MLTEYLDSPLIWLLPVLMLATFALWLWRRRVRSRSIPFRLDAATQGRLSNFLIPDGEGGEIHIEHALLTPSGVVLVDIREVSGNVFGSDSMDDWTVMDRKERYTFSNPQNGLFDRVAAMTTLLPDVPVSGYIAFTETAIFPKGQPGHTILFDALLEELSRQQVSGAPYSRSMWRTQWESMEQQAARAER